MPGFEPYRILHQGFQGDLRVTRQLGYGCEINTARDAKTRRTPEAHKKIGNRFRQSTIMMVRKLTCFKNHIKPRTPTMARIRELTQKDIPETVQILAASEPVFKKGEGREDVQKLLQSAVGRGVIYIAEEESQVAAVV